MCICICIGFCTCKYRGEGGRHAAWREAHYEAREALTVRCAAEEQGAEINKCLLSTRYNHFSQSVLLRS